MRPDGSEGSDTTRSGPWHGIPAASPGPGAASFFPRETVRSGERHANRTFGIRCYWLAGAPAGWDITTGIPPRGVEGGGAAAGTGTGGKARVVTEATGSGRRSGEILSEPGTDDDTTERVDTESGQAARVDARRDARDDAVTPVIDLVNELAADGAGLSLIYNALDDVVERCNLDDAALVVEEPGLGRQVFRAGRRPITDDDEALLTAPTGLYTEPEIGEAEFDPKLLVNLCILALRLEVLRYDAWHDPLTGLYDRRSFDRLLEMSTARAQRYGWPFTLVIVDVDHLKEINDNDGHSAGDAALRAVADRFRNVLRFGDNAARIGGDEFALILPDTTRDQVPALLERVSRGDDPTGVPSFSFGSAHCPTEAKDYDALFRLADERMYLAKGQPV